MNSGKNFDYRSLLLPAVFVILLVLTIILHQKAFSQDKEALGTDVYVKVIDVKTKSGGLNPGGLSVTVSYQGEMYKLHGVPSSDHFVMKNSKTYGSAVKAKLYNGELYYKSTSIYLLADKLYFACLAAALVTFSAMFLQWKEKLHR